MTIERAGKPDRGHKGSTGAYNVGRGQLSSCIAYNKICDYFDVQCCVLDLMTKCANRFVLDVREDFPIVHLLAV